MQYTVIDNFINSNNIDMTSFCENINNATPISTDITNILNIVSNLNEEQQKMILKNIKSNTLKAGSPEYKKIGI
jgi:hypothetical protein